MRDWGWVPAGPGRVGGVGRVGGARRGRDQGAGRGLWAGGVRSQVTPPRCAWFSREQRLVTLRREERVARAGGRF